MSTARACRRAGTILADLTGGELGGPEHDRTAPERLKATIY